jgi:hypothetical protein
MEFFKPPELPLAYQGIQSRIPRTVVALLAFRTGPQLCCQTLRLPLATQDRTYIAGFLRLPLAVQNRRSCARNYRPSFRENKPKTLILYD